MPKTWILLQSGSNTITFPGLSCAKGPVRVGRKTPGVSRSIFGPFWSHVRPGRARLVSYSTKPGKLLITILMLQIIWAPRNQRNRTYGIIWDDYCNEYICNSMHIEHQHPPLVSPQQNVRFPASLNGPQVATLAWHNGSTIGAEAARSEGAESCVQTGRPERQEIIGHINRST